MRFFLLLLFALILDHAAVAQTVDPLPERALQRIGTPRLRHGSRIMALAFTPNGKNLAAAGGDDLIRLWDLETGKLTWQSAEAEPWVQALAFSPRGAAFFTGGAFKSVRFWESISGRPLGKLDKHTTPVKALALSPDSTLIASGSQDGTIILWETIVRLPVIELKNHNDEINQIVFSPDSALFASVSADRTVRVWDVEKNNLLHTLPAGCHPYAACFLYDGNPDRNDVKRLASAGDDNLITLWDAKAGTVLGKLAGHASAVVSLVGNKKGTQLISASLDGAVIVWDVEKKTKLQTFQRSLGDADALALSPDGKLVAVAGIHQAIRLFEVESGKEIHLGKGPQAGIAGAVLLDAGKVVASVTAHGEVQIWEAGVQKKAWNLKRQPLQHADYLLASAPDHKLLATANNLESEFRLWTPEGKDAGTLPLVKGEAPVSLHFAPGGKHLAVGLRSGKVELWDVPAKQKLKTLAYPGVPYALAFTTKHDRLAVSGESSVVLFDVAAGTTIRTFPSKEGMPATATPSVASLAYSPDGKMLALGCRDSLIRLLDADTGKEIRALEGHASVVNSLAFSFDSRTLVSGSFDKTARLWEVFSGKSIRTFNGHIGEVTAVAISSDARTLLSASTDTTMLLWDATSVAAKLSKSSDVPPPFSTLWDQLAHVEASVGQPALWEFVPLGNVGAGHIEKKVAEILVDPAAIDRWLTELSSPDFTTRDTARIELEKKGIWMEGRLRVSLKGTDNLESIRRIQKMLEKIQGRLPLEQERLRLRRIMAALEQIGTAEAIKTLKDLARGAPEKDLQVEAQETVVRMMQRSVKSG